MSPDQYSAYLTARDLEIEESGRSFSKGKPKSLTKPQGASSSYRVRSRQISNYLYPEEASHHYRDTRGIPRYKKFIDKLESKHFEWSNLLKQGRKLPKLLINLKHHLPKNMLSNVPDSLNLKPKKGGCCGNTLNIVEVNVSDIYYRYDAYLNNKCVGHINIEKPDKIS